MHKKDTIADILSAPDRDELINWLRNQPLLIEQGDVLFAHAGIHPLWDLPTAQKLAQEAHEALAGPQWQRWLQGMYGNTQWSPDLTGENACVRFSMGLLACGLSMPSQGSLTLT